MWIIDILVWDNLIAHINVYWSQKKNLDKPIRV